MFGSKASQDDALSEGARKFKSTGKFKAKRDGNIITIEGTIEHDGGQNYDFEEGGSGDDLGVQRLKKAELLKEYRVERSWSQSVRARVQIVKHPRDGSETRRVIDVEFKDIDP